MKRIALPFVALMLALMGCTPQPNLVILHAGSLSVPFDEATEAFEELNPGVTIVTESAGSRTTIRKVTELGKRADVVAVADYTVIEDLMFPDYADWYIWFARNEMVIAYSEHSKFSDEIDGENWYQILLRDDVQYGHSDPDQDPCGYRTLMLWQLAEIYYDVPGLYDDLDAGCPPQNIRPKETDLIALQQAGALDYVFQYRSVAEQHDLEYLELPEEINLSSPEFAEFYSHAQVAVSGKEPGTSVTLTGAPIIYGVTIPQNAPHPDLAIAFLKFLLGKEGQAITAENGQPPIVPAVASDPDRLPEELKQFVLP